MDFFKPDQEVIYNSFKREPKFVNAKAIIQSVTISKYMGSIRIRYSISIKQKFGEYITTHIIDDVTPGSLTYSAIPKEGDIVRDKFTGLDYTLSHYVYTPDLYILTRGVDSEKMTAISKKNFSHYFYVVK